MKIDTLLVIVAVYFTYLIQISVFASWSIFGGSPNLIAIFIVLFLVFDKWQLGLIWVVIGSFLIDLSLPVQVGVTLIPLLVTYWLTSKYLNKLFSNYEVMTIVGIGLLFLFISEFLLAMISLNWYQLLKDMLAGIVILLPLAQFISKKVKPYRIGLKV